MEGQSSQASEDAFDSVTKISEVINEKDQKLIANEALTIHTKLEIGKLQNAIKELNRQSQNLEAETALMQKEVEDLQVSIERSRKSLEVKSDMYVDLKQEISKLEAETNAQANQYEAAYTEFREKYKRAREPYEIYHPLFNQLKELQNETFKSEVSCKILQANISEKKKQIQSRREINEKIFHTTIVKFAENTVNYWKNRDLARSLKSAENEERDLLQQLHDVEALNAKTNSQFQQMTVTPVSQKPTTIENTEFMAEDSWNELDKTNNSPHFAVPAPVATPTFSSNFNPFAPPSRSNKEMLRQLRARCDQRQRQWERQPSFSTSPRQHRTRTLLSANSNQNQQMPVFAQAPLHGQKRFAQQFNVPNLSSSFKLSKPTVGYNAGNENSPFINQAAVQRSSTFTPFANDHLVAHNSKAKIISVHSIRTNENAIGMGQHALGMGEHAVAMGEHSFQNHSLPQDINKKSNPVMSQRSPHHASQDPSSQVQPQETQSNTTAALPQQYSQIYYRENFFAEEVNDNTPIQSGNIDKQGVAYNAGQAPLQYRSENIVSQSQPRTAQQMTQEISQNQYPVAQLKSGATQNLTNMHLSGNQAAATQASNKSGGNTAVTSQSSTFSQNYMQLQHFLDTEFQEADYRPTPAVQNQPNQPAEAVLTSPFFNTPKQVETTQLLQTQATTQELMPTSPPDDQYLGNTSEFYNSNVDFNMSDDVDGGYPQALSPDYDESNNDGAFNFAQPQTKQTGELTFAFGSNTGAGSNNIFNMF